MPRLNSFGIPTTGYGVCWYDDQNKIFQDCSSGVCKIVLSNGLVIKEHGCNILFARNGIWMAWGGGENAVFGSLGLYMAGAGITSGPSPVASELISPEGAVCIRDLYYSYGPWHVHEPNGSIWKLTDGDAHSIQLLGEQKAIYLLGNSLYKTDNLDLEIPSRLMWWPRTAKVNDKWKLLYQDYKTGQLVLDGKVIGLSANYYRPDFMQLDNGSIKVVWSPDEGESIIYERILTLEQLATLPNIEDILEIPTYNFNHQILVTPFNAIGESKALAEIIINKHDQIIYRPYIIAEDSIGISSVKGKLLGIYSESVNPPITLCEKYNTRLFLGHDSASEWNLPSNLRPFDIPLLEVYRLKSETLNESINRWKNSIAKLLSEWDYDIGLIPQFYTQDIWTIKEVLEGLRYLDDLVNLTRAIKIVAPFAYSRTNGILAYPELQKTYDNLTFDFNLDSLIPIPKSEPIPIPIPKPSNYDIVELKLMEPEIVSLVAFDRYGRVLGDKVVFDRISENSETEFEISKPDSKFAIKKNGKFVGADATNYSFGIDKQFYITDNRGNYESWFIGKTPSGLYIAFIEYREQGVNNTVPFVSAPVTIKRKK